MRRISNPFLDGIRPKRFLSPLWKVYKRGTKRIDKRKFDPNWNKETKPKRA